MSGNRKCLGVLQPSMQNQLSLTTTPDNHLQLKLESRGKKRKSSENFDVSKPKRRDGIYEDPVSKKAKKCNSVEIQTDISNSKSSSTHDPSSVIDMLTSETAPLEYWEGLAERRREALEEALKENEELHTENTRLNKEVAILREDNALMENMLEEAKQLALLLEPVVKDDDDTPEAEREETGRAGEAPVTTLTPV